VIIWKSATINQKAQAWREPQLREPQYYPTVSDDYQTLINQELSHFQQPLSIANATRTHTLRSYHAAHTVCQKGKEQLGKMFQTEEISSRHNPLIDSHTWMDVTSAGSKGTNDNTQ
jgi:hypothetical protein